MFNKKKFKSISASDFNTENSEEIKKAGEDNKEILESLQEALKDYVEKVVAADLGEGTAALTAEGEVSLEMEKVLTAINKSKAPKAKRVLQINPASTAFISIKALHQTDKESFKNVAMAIYYQAAVLEGLSIDKPEKFAEVIDNLIRKLG